MLVILAKIGSPEMVGLFVLGLTITAPVLLFASLNTRLAQATDAKHEYQFADYLGLRLITTALALLVIIGIIIVSEYHQKMALVIFAVGTAKAFESISDTFYGLFLQRERMDRIAKSKIVRGILSLVALGIVTYLTGSVFWGVVGLAISWALVMRGYDIRSGVLMLKSDLQKSGSTSDFGDSKIAPLMRWDMRQMIQLAWLALPLGVVAALGSLMTNIPRYLVERFLGVYELGIFAALAYIKVASNTVVLALGQSASPRLAKYYATKNIPAYRQLILKLMIIGALLGVALLLVTFVAGEEILTLIYQPEYAKYHKVFVWLMVAAAIDHIATFLHYSMTAARYFRVQVPLFALFVGVAALTGVWLIPIYGLLGAAMTLVIATIVRAVGSMIIVLHAMRKLQSHT
jgi:O-antigen/teichoic acid export membrane protein